MSVGFQLVAYGGRDDKLFRAAIMQSGSPVYYYNLNDSSALEPKYQSLLTDTGCSDLACLRSLPFEDLNDVLNQTKFITWVPAIDHDIIQGFTSTQLVTGNFVKVPIISGTNTDEGTAFSPLGIDTETDFINVLTCKTLLPLPFSASPKIVHSLTSLSQQPSRSPATSSHRSSPTTPMTPPEVSQARHPSLPIFGSVSPKARSTAAAQRSLPTTHSSRAAA